MYVRIPLEEGFISTTFSPLNSAQVGSNRPNGDLYSAFEGCSLLLCIGTWEPSWDHISNILAPQPTLLQSKGMPFFTLNSICDKSR